jgi:hypothetical protein
MKRIVREATWVMALMGSIGQAAPVMAQAASDLQNKMIEIEYVEPINSSLRPIYERFRKREILESLKQFLSPLKLSLKLRITALQCNETNAYWAGRTRGLLLCYEYADWIARLAPATPTPEGFTREDTIAGEFIETALHEMGHAVFDLFDAPIFGREEDAADQMAGFIMLQFGREVALRTISGTAAAYQAQARQRTLSRSSFSDEHGTDQQRFYNYLCLAYGAEPAAFQRFVDTNVLPPTRAVHCAHEYQQIKNAFEKTILPHVDRDLMKAVQSTQWLRPDDGK